VTLKAYITAVMNKLTYVSFQGRVRTAVRRGGQFCCSFAANLIQYLCAKNHLNTLWFDKIIAKIKGAIFLPHSVLFSATGSTKTRSVAAGFGRQGMPPPASNDTGTALGQDGSD